MTRFGRYHPQNPRNSSALFVFQEVPVTSAKLNAWDGNLAAGFELLHRVLSEWLAGDAPGVLACTGDQGLQVQPSDPPSLRVQLHPGVGVWSGALAGLSESLLLPEIGSFSLPQDYPRRDWILLHPSGEFSLLTGEESAAPQAPAQPADTLPLAQIHLRPGATRILADDNGTEGFIIDARPRLITAGNHRHAHDRRPPEVPDGIRTGFTTGASFHAGTLEVYLNGVLQEEGWDYLENPDGTGYQFIQAPAATHRIQHRYLHESA